MKKRTPAATAPAVPAVSSERVYEVLPPYGLPSIKVLQPINRLDTLEGKTICGLFGGSYHFEETFPKIAELLKKKYPTASFIGPDVISKNQGINSVWPDWEARNPQLIANLIKQYKCDAVVSGNGC
jgi:hypothetical protein